MHTVNTCHTTDAWSLNRDSIRYGSVSGSFEQRSHICYRATFIRQFANCVVESLANPQSVAWLSASKRMGLD